MHLSEAAKAELEHMYEQVRSYPDDEAEPTGRFDKLPENERHYIMEEYKRIGGR